MHVELEGSKGAPGQRRAWGGLQRAKVCMLVAIMANITAIVAVCAFVRQEQPRIETDGWGDLEATSDGPFLVDTPGCRIPELGARDPLVLRYVNDVKPVSKCSEVTFSIGGRTQRGPPLVRSNLTAMWVVPEALHHYNVSHLGSLACCYRPFWRVQQNRLKYDSDADVKEKFSATCHEFSGVTQLGADEEFVQVECHHVNSSQAGGLVRGSEIYRDFHAFVPTKPPLEERCDKVPRTDHQVSVLILGIDAVSRLNMLRELPLLHAALSSLSSVSLLGYTKVGDNTFPNVVPVLAGLAEDQLRGACPWPSARHKLDPCPFLWKQFAARGYRTAYGGDCTWMSIFNHEKTGFVEAPTDYYLRPFMRVAEQSAHSTLLHANLCLGPRLTISYILDYVRKFATRFQNERTFSFFWATSLSHDNLTVPHIGDGDISELVRDLAASGALNRTVLVMLSDHGIRYGAIRETYQGMMEERLPFLHLAFPAWFEARFPAAVANVRRNARRLTSPFDLHETLKDLLDPEERLQDEALRTREDELVPWVSSGSNSSLVDNIISKYKTLTQPKRRGISLFLPIPPERTCSDAGISPHYCTCQTSTAIPVDSTSAERASHFLVSRLNALLSGSPQCARLWLREVRGARRSEPERRPGAGHAVLVDFTVTLRTEPGGGVFEATVRQAAPVTSQLRLAGPISRLNLYGNQSSCVDDYKIKLYCYCS